MKKIFPVTILLIQLGIFANAQTENTLTGYAGIVLDRGGWPYILFKENGTVVGRIQGTGGNFAITNPIGTPNYLTVNSTTGNVGIGTSSAAFKLDVEAPAVRIKNSSTSLDSYTSFRLQGPDYVNGLEIDVFGNNNINNNINWSYGGGAGSAAIVNVNAKPLVFGTSNQGRMLIDAAGNVGIGTTSPNQKLTVNGTIYGKEVKVDLNVPGPDYVFEEDYNLPSLTEIENYIKQNNHLPEVPSAKEMETNGISLSEMNMILLKKVEELTLHLIEMKKENESTKVKISNMQNEINKLKK